eukprot:2069997-Pleurochrysis_carterae.AAC.1
MQNLDFGNRARCAAMLGRSSFAIRTHAAMRSRSRALAPFHLPTALCVQARAPSAESCAHRLYTDTCPV